MSQTINPINLDTEFVPNEEPNFILPSMTMRERLHKMLEDDQCYYSDFAVHHASDENEVEKTKLTNTPAEGIPTKNNKLIDDAKLNQEWIKNKRKQWNEKQRQRIKNKRDRQRAWNLFSSSDEWTEINVNGKYRRYIADCTNYYEYDSELCRWAYYL